MQEMNIKIRKKFKIPVAKNAVGKYMFSELYLLIYALVHSCYFTIVCL